MDLELHIGEILQLTTLVREGPSCYDPTNVSTVSVGSDSATISWSTDPSVTTWNYVLGAANFDPLTATPVSVTSSTLVLSGLTPASNYDFYVQSDCGTSGVSNWIGPLSFSTDFADTDVHTLLI